MNNLAESKVVSDGARYYAPELGRFTAIDPLAGKYPSLSPYVYCANNPMKFVDPNGEALVMNGSQAATQNFERICSNSLPSTTRLSVEKGVVNLSSTGLEGPPLPEQQAFESTIAGAVDATGTVEMSLVSNSESVLVGSYATGEMDMADIMMSPTDGPASQASFVAHEVAEQTAKQLGGLSREGGAHNSGLSAEKAVNGGWGRTGEKSTGGWFNPWTMKTTLTYKNGSSTKEVTMKYTKQNVDKVTVQ